MTEKENPRVTVHRRVRVPNGLPSPEYLEPVPPHPSHILMEEGRVWCTGCEATMLTGGDASVIAVFAGLHMNHGPEGSPGGDTSSQCRRCNASKPVTEMWTKPGRGYLCENCVAPPPPPSDELVKLQERAQYAHEAWAASSEDAGRLEREKTVLILALRDSLAINDHAVVRHNDERRVHDRWSNNHAEAIKLATRIEDGEEESR